MEHPFTEVVPGVIWVSPYPVRYAGTRFEARMTAIRLPDGRVVLHSPGPLGHTHLARLAEIGPVEFLIAPGTYHHLHMAEAQAAFLQAETHICPGIARKRPDLRFDAMLSDTAPAAWAGVMDQVVLRGSRWMWEVVFLHRASRTLIVTDLIELFTDATPRIDWKLKAWWRLFGMWNKPHPAPEYRFGWRDRTAARESLARILAWDFDRIILSHGDLVDRGGKSVAAAAFATV
ncbi:Methanol oxidation protein [Rhodovulum sp. P5]|uniref:DUF4336 domain-containing protein n=1 Tax=Rhodovulum sp. P5 TaxID=1564506 RepID=UPI0009C1B8CF|nr:DUF4336 domain-containing protein [Rhodovulum sp. P5]ARE38616.1 Methanol oxidation protein [Rhodovulum sp. P5]